MPTGAEDTVEIEAEGLRGVVAWEGAFDLDFVLPRLGRNFIFDRRIFTLVLDQIDAQFLNRKQS